MPRSWARSSRALRKAAVALEQPQWMNSPRLGDLFHHRPRPSRLLHIQARPRAAAAAAENGRNATTGASQCVVERPLLHFAHKLSQAGLHLLIVEKLIDDDTSRF